MDHFEDRWWEPGELLEAAHAIRRSTPEDDFFCDSAYQPVREAIATAEQQAMPVVRDAEFDSRDTTQNYYWEGEVTGTGTQGGESRSAVGFVELVGY